MRGKNLRLWLIAFLTVGVASWWQLPALRAQAPPPEARILYGAGDSIAGQLGTFSFNLSPARLFPSPANPFDDVVDAAIGSQHSLVLRSDGSVWATGNNVLGQLGVAGYVGAPPIHVNNLPEIVKVAAGANHSLALDNTGAVWAWGSDSNGQLGIGAGNGSSPAPAMIPTLQNVVDIAAGTDFSVAVESDGTIWAWGSNQFLQLGNPGPSQTTPISVPKGLGFFATHVVAGGKTAMALSNGGQVIAWGFNGSLQIAPSGSAIPAGAPIASGIREMAVGDGHVLLLKTDGTVVARGNGTSGQLGNGNVTSSSVFVTVPGLAGVKDIAAGFAHSAAVLSDGSFWTWGSNNRSQLGNNSSPSFTSPTKVQNFPATGRSVSAAQNSTFFINAPGDVGVDFKAPTGTSCTTNFNTQVSLTGYDVYGITPSDIVLVLDESGSISAANFNLLKQFAHNFVTAQNIGPTANRVGVVMFSTDARVVINLSSDKTTLLAAIDGIVARGGYTCIGCGVATADSMLNTFGRPTANRMMVVVTDGFSTPNIDTDFESTVLSAQQTSTIFAIGVGASVSPPEIDFIASDVPNVTTSFLTPDFASLTTIIANLSLDLGPAFTNVVVTLNRSQALGVIGSPTVTSGNVSSSANGLVTWTLPTLGSTKVTLILTQHGLGQNGTVPLFDSIHYDVGKGPVDVAVPTIDITGCPASVELNPPSATHVTGTTHFGSFAALNATGSVLSVPMIVQITSGPNVGRVFNATPSGVPASFSYSSTLPGTDTLQAYAPGYPVTPATATVEWKVPNTAPTANAGGDQVVLLSGNTTATFTLHGSGTDDGNVQPLTFSWSEGGSPAGVGADLTLTRAAGGYDFTLTAFDGELSGSDSVHVIVGDGTPPLVAPIITGNRGANGWYVGPVAVDWKVVDHESAIVSPACGPTLLKDDGANQLVTCFAQSAGGKTNAKTSVNIDSTPPVVTAPPDQLVFATGALTPVSYSGESATDATSGIATFGCLPASGTAFKIGSTTVTCSATDAAGNSSSADFTVNVSAASTSLQLVTVPSTALVGNDLAVVALLNRSSAPAGPLGNQQVTFSLTGPNGTTQLTAMSDASGFATVGFPLAAPGSYSLTAAYAGTAALKPSFSTPASVLVLQRTALVVQPASGPVGSPITVTAMLLAIPQNTPISGQPVLLLSTGSPALVDASTTTDANGVVSATWTYQSTGSFTATATFSNYTFVDGSGAPVPTTATGPVTVTKSSTSLSLSAPPTAFIGSGSSFTAKLMRSGPSSGPVVNEPVVFTVALPGGGTWVLDRYTDPSGEATIGFPTSLRGIHTVSAEFAGGADAQSSSSNSVSFTAYQRTTLTLSSATGEAGSPLVFDAILSGVPLGTRITNELVTVSFGGVVPSQTVMTDGAGQVHLAASFPNAGSFTATAAFSNAAGFFTDESGTLPAAAEIVTAPVTVTMAGTQLQSTTTQYEALVGGSFTAAVTLFRNDGGGPIAAQSIAFTFIAPGGGTTQLTGTTDANGLASTTFTPAVLGSHTVTANFAGTGGLQPSASNPTQFLVYQRTLLTLAAAAGTAGSQITLSATLSNTPLGVPLVGKTVVFSFGGSLPGATAVTDVNGVASVVVVFPNAGVFPAVASFDTGVDFYTDHNGSLPPVAETSTAAVTVSLAATSLSTPSAPTATLVGGSLTASATLNRSSAPVGPLSGMAVVFTLTAPGGGTTQLTGTTNAAGLATVTFAPTLSGAHSVSAQFAATATLQASSSNTATVTVYQRTTLTLSSATGTPGSPLMLTAALLANPQGVAVAGQAIVVSFGGAAPAQSVVTDASGVANIFVTFPNAGTFSAVASFSNGADFFTDHNGALPPVAESATASVTVSDPTPPVIVATVTGTLGANNWYTSDVTVSWSATDPDGAITNSSGCTTSTTNTDGASFTKTCTATSAGGTSTKSVTFKRDASAPNLVVSSNKTEEADSWDGADVTYAAATATDPTSGIASVTCAPPSGSTFPIGVTTVSCVATNNAGLTKTGTFTVTVTDHGEPGRMFGVGEAPAPSNHQIDFNFVVLENRRGNEWGDVKLKVRDTRRRRGDDERFDARTVDDVVFSDSPDYGPGRNSRTGVDTVTFRGTGKWDGRSGYSYVVTASDRGEPGRGRDTFTIEIKAPNGAVVFSGGGILTDGNVQSSRLNRPWSWWNGHHDNPRRR